VDLVVWMSVPAVSISAPKIAPSSIWRTLAGTAGLAAFFVALVSYSVYLSHPATLFTVQRLATDLRLAGHSRLLFAEVVGIPTACLVGAVLYVLVEKPFLILRERLPR